MNHKMLGVEELTDHPLTPYYFEKAPEILDEMHRNQQINRFWSESMEKAASRFLEQDLFEGTQLRDTDCRESLCKMVLGHDDADAYEVFKRHGASTGPWLKSDIQGKRAVKDSGEIETTIYFSREEDTAPFEEMREQLLSIVNKMETEGEP